MLMEIKVCGGPDSEGFETRAKENCVDLREDSAGNGQRYIMRPVSVGKIVRKNVNIYLRVICPCALRNIELLLPVSITVLCSI
jgi:hypothetical protein